MSDMVLLVEDDSAVREALAQTLDLAALTPIVAGSFVAAKDHITRDFPGVILSDIRMPGRDGFHLLGHARAVDEDLPVVLLTGEADIPMAVAAMEQGAFDFLEKPCAPADLVEVMNRALAVRRKVLEARAEQAMSEAGDPAARLIFGVTALAEGLRTLDDADDFVPRGDALEAELDVAAIARSHGVGIVSDSGRVVAPHEAVARYAQHAARRP